MILYDYINDINYNKLYIWIYIYIYYIHCATDWDCVFYKSKSCSSRPRFYVIMDKDNDGLDPIELLEFIQGNQEVRPDVHIGNFAGEVVLNQSIFEVYLDKMI